MLAARDDSDTAQAGGCDAAVPAPRGRGRAGAARRLARPCAGALPAHGESGRARTNRLKEQPGDEPTHGRALPVQGETEKQGRK